METVLVVEDESGMRRFLHDALSTAGFTVVEAHTAALAEQLANEARPAAILMDLGLPDADGISLLRRLRAWCATPVIVLSARHREDDKVMALDAGADDYLTKPFSVNELLARIRALLRRRSPDALDAVVEVGALSLNPASHRVVGNGREVKIGATEFKLLHFLMSHPERVHSRNQLLDRVWGDHVFIEERTVDVHIKRLRETLSAVDCQHMIETVRGAGYRLARSQAVTV